MFTVNTVPNNLNVLMTKEYMWVRSLITFQLHCLRHFALMTLKANMWLMQVGSLSHFICSRFSLVSIIVMIAKGDSLSWSLYSPDLTSLDLGSVLVATKS